MAGLIGFVQNAAMLFVIGMAFIGETIKAEYIVEMR
jgi:hypothetical protein